MSTHTPMSEPSETNIAPWLSVSNAEKALDFYSAAFNAIELYRLEDDNGKLVVAQLSSGERISGFKKTPAPALSR